MANKIKCSVFTFVRYINHDVAVTHLITPRDEKCYDHTLHNNFGGNKWRYDDSVTTVQIFTLKVIKSHLINRI